ERRLGRAVERGRVRGVEAVGAVLRVIGCRAGAGAGRAREVEDPAPAARLHSRDDELREMVGREQVDRIGELDALRRLRVTRAEARPGGVVDQDVDAAVMAERGADDALAVGGAGEVGLYAHTVAAGRADAR